MKSLINQLLPYSVLVFFKKIYHSFFLFYYGFCDLFLFLKHSSILSESNNQSKLVARISMAYHGIEKGLTMPNRRLGFGKKGLLRVLSLCDLYIKKKYDTTNNQFLHALGVLYEYRNLHGSENFILNDEIVNRINKFELQFPVQPTKQLESSNEKFFKHVFSSFDKFSESRFSIRSFEKGLNESQIKNAIALAQNTPSSCNRQATRIHLVRDEEIKQKVLNLHKGNRGFGHLSDSIILVTAEVGGYASAIERNAAFIDGGMYGMNLLYALHFHKIGACVLNSNFTTQTANELRKICKIPKSEVFVMLILIGRVPESLSVALSKREEISSVMKII